jgi:hypothetical protein
MRTSIRWGIATLIVAFPLFAWMTTILNREMRKNPEKAGSPVRRWLTYITLFFTAGVLAGDIITLLFYVLDGELSIRFLLKVSLVLLVAGMTFTYYFVALKLSPTDPRMTSLHRTFSTVTFAIVALTIVWGIVLAGSPGQERERKFDDQRLQDLRTIESEIYTITHDNKPVTGYETELRKPLPASLDEVSKNATYAAVTTTDPETGVPYEYTVETPTTYKLCASFNLAREQQYDVFWDHPAGHHCYEFDALSTVK